jgi:hypothetical protein
MLPLALNPSTMYGKYVLAGLQVRRMTHQLCILPLIMHYAASITEKQLLLRPKVITAHAPIALLYYLRFVRPPSAYATRSVPYKSGALLNL